MVSSAVDMSLQELLDTLERLRCEHGDDPEYQAARGELPADWALERLASAAPAPQRRCRVLTDPGNELPRVVPGGQLSTSGPVPAR